MKSIKASALCIVAASALMLTACGSSTSTSTDEDSTVVATEEIQEENLTTEASVDTVAAEATTEAAEEEEWASVKALGLDDDTMLAIYNDYMAAWETSPDATHEGEYTTEDIAAEDEYEAQVSQDIADKYGIEVDAADSVYYYVMANYDDLMTNKGANVSNLELNYNELLDVTTNGGTIVIKVKVSPSMNNSLTVKGCGFDVYEAIQDYGLDQYDEIQYWGVADMTDGTEQKVISFTVSKDLIEKIANGSVLENQVVQNASDVWVHQSLADWNS